MRGEIVWTSRAIFVNILETYTRIQGHKTICVSYHSITACNIYDSIQNCNTFVLNLFYLSTAFLFTVKPEMSQSAMAS